MFQFLPCMLRVIFDENLKCITTDYSFMNINSLRFRKPIRYWQKETDWKMVRDITFENCCFKSKVYKTVCQDMVNYSGAMPCDSSWLINFWYHAISIYEISKFLYFFTLLII